MADEKRELLKQARRRLTKAERGQQIHRPRIDDIYRYMQPWRMRHFEQQPNLDEVDEIFDSTGIEVLEDFAADMGNTFTPMNQAWVDVQPVKRFGDGDLRNIEQQLREYRDTVFDHIARSNFAEAAQEAYPDLFPGTMAMLIEDIDPAEPIHCEAVPLPELLIDRSPRGRGVGPTFRRMTVRVEDIKVIWPDAELPAHLEARRQSSPDVDVPVTWGLWRDYTKDTETYQFILWTGGQAPSSSGEQGNDPSVGGDVLLTQELEGAGSSPIVVARWAPDGVTAYGVGPGHKALPDVKTKNKTRELILRNADLATDPPFAYDDDGVLNFAHGIVPGMGYPRMPGSSIDTIDPRRQFDVSFLVDDDLRMSILRAGFQDKPLQRGKTPPTATQFMEEQLDKAQRMGSPAGRLITEWQYPIFRRFAYLLEQRGVLPRVQLNGEDVALKPVSPLTKSQQQQEALNLERWAESVATKFPQAAAAIINPFEYATRQADYWGVKKDGLVQDPQNLVELARSFGGADLLGGGSGGQ